MKKVKLLSSIIILATVAFIAACGSHGQNSPEENEPDGDTWSGIYMQDTAGKSYRAIAIGQQIWMVDNMATDTATDGSPVTCLSNFQATSDYGCLYNSTDAMKVCPAGWHLPDRAEFETLLKSAGTNNNQETPNPAALALMAKDAAWQSEYSDKANNSTLFSALPAGYWNNGNYHNFGKSAAFWSATIKEENMPDGANSNGNYYAYYLDLGNGQASVSYVLSHYTLSVRCVKNN